MSYSANPRSTSSSNLAQGLHSSSSALPRSPKFEWTVSRANLDAAETTCIHEPPHSPSLVPLPPSTPREGATFDLNEETSSGLYSGGRSDGGLLSPRDPASEFANQMRRPSKRTEDNSLEPITNTKDSMSRSKSRENLTVGSQPSRLRSGSNALKKPSPLNLLPSSSSGLPIVDRRSGEDQGYENVRGLGFAMPTSQSAREFPLSATSTSPLNPNNVGGSNSGMKKSKSFGLFSPGGLSKSMSFFGLGSKKDKEEYQNSPRKSGFSGSQSPRPFPSPSMASTSYAYPHSPRTPRTPATPRTPRTPVYGCVGYDIDRLKVRGADDTTPPAEGDIIVDAETKRLTEAAFFY